MKTLKTILVILLVFWPYLIDSFTLNQKPEISIDSFKLVYNMLYGG